MIKLLLFTTSVFNYCSSFIDLSIRVWLFKSFFFSGLLKLESWSSTLQLFRYEYKVPLLTPTLAAYLGTFIELTIPSLLLIGLFSRISTCTLFIFNVMIVISYPFLFTDQGQAGLHQHFYWGFLMLVLVVHGPGKLSLDHLLSKKYPAYLY